MNNFSSLKFEGSENNGWGDSAPAVILRLLSSALDKIAMLNIGLTSLFGVSAILLRLAAPTMIAGVASAPIVLGGLGAIGAGYVTGVVASLLSSTTDRWADMMDIDGLLSHEDMRAINKIVSKNKQLINEMKRYKNVYDLPSNVRKDLYNAVRDQFETSGELKSAIEEARHNAHKSLIMYKSLNIQENTRFLI